MPAVGSNSTGKSSARLAESSEPLEPKRERSPVLPAYFASIPSMREAFQEAFDKHKGDESANPYPDPPHDYFKTARDISRLCSYLEHDSPERAALIKAAGIAVEGKDPLALLGRAARILGQSLLTATDSLERREMPLFGRCERPDEETPSVLGLNARPLSKVRSQEVQWIWPLRFPQGKLTIISGDPDLGKTWLVLDLMARLSTGRPMPDGTYPSMCVQPGFCVQSLWVSAEDQDEDTIVPRLLMLKADTSRIQSMMHIDDGKTHHDLSLSCDLDWLETWLIDHPLCRLVVLDPIAAFLGGRVDSHNNSQMRALLRPLSKLAARRQVAIIGINHLNKGDGSNAMQRQQGSIALVAVARSSWQVTADPKSPKDRRLFTRVKVNVAPDDPGGLAFRIGGHVGGLLWEEGRVNTTANDALSDGSRSRAPARHEAKQWLLDVLKNGPVSSQAVEEKAKDAGICRATLHAAKDELGVASKKTGGTGGGWEWGLPINPSS
jgi:AAA domain